MASPLGLTATFAIVTPLFLGGARSDEVTIRASSLRGALRFWWRFLAWADPEMQAGGDEERLARLRHLETLLFGHAGSRRTSRQAALSIRVEPRRTALKIWTVAESKKDQRLPGPKGERVVGPGARYLGYGLMEAFDSKANDKRPAKRGGELSRPCILPDQGFRVQFRLTPPGDLGAKGSLYTAADFERAKGLFHRALCLFGLVGGLGSRARRGWGSIALHALEVDGILHTLADDLKRFKRPTNIEEYKKVIEKLLPPRNGTDPRPPFTALGAESQIEVLIQDEEHAVEVLDKLGRGMQRYRSWGKDGKVNRQPSEENFQKDHDWFRRNSNFPDKQFVPERAVFGLPLNYDKNFGIAPPTDRLDRRASPLFLHVHRLASDWAIGVALLLPARFLPGEKDGWGDVAVKQNARTDNRRYSANWDVLRQLLDGFPQPDSRGRAPYFPQKVKVWP